MKTYEDTTVIIPVLNEEKTIGKLIKILEKMYPQVSIIVSDDGSKDKTQEVVKKIGKSNKKVKLIDRGRKSVKGLTISVLDGIELTKTEYSLIIDGDLQHPPEKIKEIIGKLRKGNDLVVGYRKTVCVDWPWYRRVITKSGLLLGKARLVITGVSCKDILSGFFGFKTVLIKDVLKNNKNSFEMEGYKVLFDILKNLNRNTQVVDVPFSFDVRREGYSKLSNKIMIKYLKSILR